MTKNSLLAQWFQGFTCYTNRFYFIAANALAVVGSVLARTGEKDRLILANTRP